MTIRTRLIVMTIIGLVVTMTLWGWIQIRTLDRILIDQHGRRLHGLAETVSHFYAHFPTTEGIATLDYALREHLMQDSRLARLDIISLTDDGIDYIAGASRIYFEWPQAILKTATKKFQIHYIKEETENGPALGLLYPIIPEKDKKTYVGILSYSRSYHEILKQAKELLFISSGALIMFIMVIFALGYSWLVDKPLRLITRTISSFEKGNYAERTLAMRPDELGRLADQFNSMAAKIEQEMVRNSDLNATLEERIEEATGELIRLQMELNQLEKLNALGYLTANIAHDMGTPLHSIAGLTRLLLEDDRLSEESRRKLDLIVQQTERLHSTISNIRKATRPPEPVFENLNVRDLLKETTALIEPMIKQDNIILIVKDENQDCTIYGDRHRIQTALFNLIENSREALAGKGRITVLVDCCSTSEVLTISVEDNGPGISAEIIERIWKPFFSTHAGEGLRGLGLSIVNDIMKLHQGSVKIVSEPGRGTKVELIFPHRDRPAASPVREKKAGSAHNH